MNDLKLYQVSDGFESDYVAANNEQEAIDISKQMGIFCDIDPLHSFELYAEVVSEDTTLMFVDEEGNRYSLYTEFLKYSEPTLVASSQW